MESNAQSHTDDINLVLQPAPATPSRALFHNYHSGHKFGTFIAHNWYRIILWVALVVATLFLFYVVYLAGELQQHDDDVSIIQVGRHYMCRGTTGCGPDCPFINRDDPRAEIKRSSKQIDNILVKMREAQKLAEVDISNELSDLSKSSKEAVEGELQFIREKQKTCLVNVSACNVAAHQLAGHAASEDKISNSVIDINNRMRALVAIATIQGMAFSALVVQTGAVITMYRMQDISEVDQRSVKNFDEKMYHVRAHVVDIKKIMDDEIIPFVRSGVVVDSPYSKNLSVITEMESPSESVVGAMVFFMNTADEFKLKVTSIVNKHNHIQHVYSKCKQAFEGFSNSLPGKLDSQEVTKLIEGGDYNEALIKTALEPEVVTNHRKFATERSSFDSGGGVPSVRDDDNDVVPWVGIFGRPNYKKTNGESIEKDNKLFPLKSIPSDVPESLMREHTAKWSVSS